MSHVDFMLPGSGGVFRSITGLRKAPVIGDIAFRLYDLEKNGLFELN